jgi:hypothetical protein
MKEYTGHNFRLVQEYLMLMFLSLYPSETSYGRYLICEGRYQRIHNSRILKNRTIYNRYSANIQN